jgi:capsular exopolysaccharide synthesis family protein
MALGGILGLFLSGGFAFTREYLDDTLRSPEEVAEILELPVLGYIGDMGNPRLKDNKQQRPVPYVLAQPRSPVTEAFRSLRANLEFVDLDLPIKTLLVSSSSISEGKTTIATNLAIVMSQLGRRVILIDADLRRPQVHKTLGISNVMGLSDVLRNHATIKDVAQSWGNSNLIVVTSGSLPPNPAEVLSSERMAEVMNELKNTSDMVIIDSPPSILADASVLAARADGVLLVVQSNKTQMNAAMAMIDQFKRVGARVVGVALNRINTKESYYYYGPLKDYNTYAYDIEKTQPRTDKKAMKPTTCPFLGLENDSTTALGFPSEGNFCHHARPIAPVRIEHQDEYCLSAGHINCPIYQRVQAAPLPVAVAAPSYQQGRHRRMLAAVAGSLVIMAVAAFVLFGLQLPAWLNSQIQLIPRTGEIADAQVPGQTNFFLLQSTLTPLQPVTATSTLLPQIVDCPMPDGWMPYIVNPTDSLFRLSVVYSVPVDLLQHNNCMEGRTTILPGEVLYVPFLPTRTPSPTMLPTSPPVVFAATRAPATAVPTSTQQSPTPISSTQEPTATDEPTITLPPTATDVPPTRIPSNTPEPTWTLIPSFTLVPSETPVATIIIMPTETPSPPPTRTETPTATESPTSTPVTPTEVPPTATELPTSTELPTATELPTSTELPTPHELPTATEIPSATPVPSPTEPPDLFTPTVETQTPIPDLVATFTDIVRTLTEEPVSTEEPTAEGFFEFLFE